MHLFIFIFFLRLGPVIISSNSMKEGEKGSGGMQG